jgi:dimethylhistidine N-methyltransferase
MLNHNARELSERTALADDEFASAVIDGLSRPQKTLPCRFFYDARGSELFEEITRLPEYYPSRTETKILAANAADIVEGVAEGGVLVEFGSGSSLKTEILLDKLPRIAAYVSIDVSHSALEAAKRRLAARFPDLDVRPMIGNFQRPVALPGEFALRHKTGFFPGSTIGNQTPAEAQRLLRVFRDMLSPGGRLIIGVDLKKDARTLVRAYNDAAGVTAAFNLNLLARINREITPAFDLDAFRHEAIYNPRDGRIEMHLISSKAQEIILLGRRYRFEAGETIHTENSYKYSLAQFQDLARSANWLPQRVWTDADNLFSEHELSALESI